MYLDGKRKTTLSCQPQQMKLVYCTSNWKVRQWKMSSVTLSLIMLWLSSSCGSETVICSDTGSRTDSLAHGKTYWVMESHSSKGNQTGIMLTVNTEAQMVVEKNINALVKSHKAKGKVGQPNDLHGKYNNCVENSWWYFKINLLLLTFNSMSAIFLWGYSIYPNLSI